MRRFGAVLVFREGIAKADAEVALMRLRDVLDPDYLVKRTRDGYAPTATPPIEEFNDEHGGPVWYVP